MIGSQCGDMCNSGFDETFFFLIMKSSTLIYLENLCLPRTKGSGLKIYGPKLHIFTMIKTEYEYRELCCV